MSEKRFQLNKDSEWWFVQDNTIQVNEYGYRDDLTGEDKYRGLKQDLTEQETVDLLNEQQAEIERLKELERKIDRQESLINIILNNLPIHQAADIQKFVAESLKEWDS